MLPPARSAAAHRGDASVESPRVGVVVLNWNAAWFTRRCLRSLAATEHPRDRLRLVLVDNGSVDGSLEQLSAWLARPGSPEVEVLANGSNLGFAEGCNRAVRELLRPCPDRVDFVALINNDAWVEPGWLAAMLDVMARHDGCAAVSARLVLDPGFVGVPCAAADRPLSLRSVEWRPEGEGREPVDLLRAVRASGCSDEGALDWPARRVWRLAPGSTGTIWVPAGTGPGSIELTWADDRDGTVRIRTEAGAERTVLLNGVGTRLNAVGEGYDIGYSCPDPWQPGQAVGNRADSEHPVDRPDHPTGSTGRTFDPSEVETEPVEGFCGGAVLLRSEALDEVGLFDPKFFAYYEDTDLSWRLRRAGWEVRVAPGAVVHHAFGGSGGGGSRLHVFLDRRNWLLTNFRNGSRVDNRRALGAWWRGAWRLFRANVFGRARRRQSPQWQPLITWKLALLSAVAALPATRRDPLPGAEPTSKVRGILQPSAGPGAPRPRPGGPLVVHVDVGESLKAHYRAGIQRVVCSLVADLADADERIELVPIRYEPRHRRFRRVTASEYGSLLRAGLAPDVAEDRPAVASAKESLRRTLGRLGVLSAVRACRELVFGRRRRAVEDTLLLDCLPGGSVLFEVDAVWNEREVDREALLSELRASGVHVATFVHDLLPFESPGWFAPKLLDIFLPAAEAQLRHSELLVCASEATRSSVAAMCERLGIETPRIAVVPLGADPPPEPDGVVEDLAATGDPVVLPPALRGSRYLLVVGTLEPRKNHATALDAFDALSAEFEDLHLVFAGRHGWGVDDLVARLESHPLKGERLHWLADVHDDQLDHLYRHAFMVLVPSLSEGFGLPVVEALSRGVPVLASSGGALGEVGGDAAERVDPADPPAWAGAIRSQLADPAERAAALERASGFRARSSFDFAAGIGEALAAAFRSR